MNDRADGDVLGRVGQVRHVPGAGERVAGEVGRGGERLDDRPQPRRAGGAVGEQDGCCDLGQPGRLARVRVVHEVEDAVGEWRHRPTVLEGEQLPRTRPQGHFVDELLGCGLGVAAADSCGNRFSAAMTGPSSVASAVPGVAMPMSGGSWAVRVRTRSGRRAATPREIEAP